MSKVMVYDDGTGTAYSLARVSGRGRRVHVETLGQYDSQGLTEALRAEAPESELDVVLTAACALHTTVAVEPSQRRKLRQILPFLVEGQLSSPVEQMVVVPTTYKSDKTVGAIAAPESIVRQWVERAETSNLTLKNIYLDTDVLQQMGQGAIVVGQGSLFHVSVSGRGLVVPRAMLANALRDAETNALSDGITLLGQPAVLDDETLVAELGQYGPVSTAALEGSAVEAIAKLVAAKPHCVTTLYRGRRKGQSAIPTPKLTGATAVLLAGLFSINVLGMYREAVRASETQAAAWDIVEQIYEEAFRNGSGPDFDLNTYRNTLERYLEPPADHESMSLVESLAQIDKAILEHATEVLRVRYQRPKDELVLDLRLPDSGSANQVAAKLENLASNVSYTSNQRTDSVEARFTLRGGLQ